MNRDNTMLRIQILSLRRSSVVDVINVTLKGLRGYDSDVVCSEMLRSVKCTLCFFFENIINIYVICTVIGKSVLWEKFTRLYGIVYISILYFRHSILV